MYSSAAVYTRAVYTAGYLAIAGSLFSTSKRLLVENNTVPETFCTTHYRLAQKMGTKLGQQLLTTRFPSTKRVPSNAAQWCQRGLPGLGYNVYRPSLRAASCCHLMQYEIRCEYRIVYPIASHERFGVRHCEMVLGLPARLVLVNLLQIFYKNTTFAGTRFLRIYRMYIGPTAWDNYYNCYTGEPYYWVLFVPVVILETCKRAYFTEIDLQLYCLYE